MSKICKYCQTDKTLENFFINRRNKDSYENKCKDCFKEYNSKRKDKLRESQIKWREKNPEYMKNYESKPERKDYAKKYYRENADIYKKRKKEWRKNNPDREKNARDSYRMKNKDKINSYLRYWKTEKRKSDITFKLKENISRRIRYELNNLIKGKKNNKTVKYLGCNILELKTYLESKFYDDITWENYGSVWHIDHIIPCVAWNLSDEFDNFCCWNYRNLQPLKSFENKSKKDKYDILKKEDYINIMKNIYNN